MVALPVTVGSGDTFTRQPYPGVGRRLCGNLKVKRFKLKLYIAQQNRFLIESVCEIGIFFHWPGGQWALII